ncbi:MAG: cation:proton antiporter [Solirubrobacterales bacterium]|nr:cation:proton antiporter [Solirubrobacterales bacterium]MBV9424551.1 cation:proton antiporter [Solirubrobacterales bacterium]
MTASTLAPVFAAVSIKSPTGPAWEFLVLFLVVILGPPIVRRFRGPGIIGLIIGGFVIGPYGLNVIGAGDTTVPELGQLGLLYLMFVAGVELDLALVRVHRRAVASFAGLTFLLPMLFGVVIGFALSWSTPAALLLGALLSSHTLLLYPTVRQARLSTDTAVASAVGATVLTDTAALVVLAAVSGSQLAGGSPVSTALQIVIGLTVLIGFSLGLLPRLARFAFRYLGTDRVVRFLLAVASFLAAATLAESFGIEPIVGAFFAGLALNRLVPNEGPLMERIDFFGSAVFVPVFLVSVGMLLDPSVMVQGETLKLAVLFIAASMGGKLLASLFAQLTIGFSRPQASLMFGLTVPQAAATLAATVVGFNIGLFSQSVVNAVLVLILVSIIVGTVVVERFKTRVAPPDVGAEKIGRRVLVTLQDPALAKLGFAIGARIAAADTGVVRGVLATSTVDAQSRSELLAELSRAGFAAGVDTEPRLMVQTSLAEGVLHAAAEEDASLVLIGQHSAKAASALGTSAEAVAAATPVPVAIVIGSLERVGEVELVRLRDSQPNGAPAPTSASRLAAELATRLGGSRLRTRDSSSESWSAELRPGQLCIAPAASWQLLAFSDPPAGAAVIVVLEPGVPLITGQPPYADVLI